MNWNKIRSEYINGHISYRKLAEKHAVSFHALKEVANKEKWVEKRAEQREEIRTKTDKKTAEILAEKEAKRLLRISNVADKLLAKIEKATEELDVYLAKDERRYTQYAKDPRTKESVPVDVKEEVLKSVKLNRIDKAGLKQITSTLKDLRDIQLVRNEETKNEVPEINITISPATLDDMEGDEE